MPSTLPPRRRSRRPSPGAFTFPAAQQAAEDPPGFRIPCTTTTSHAAAHSPSLITPRPPRSPANKQAQNQAIHDIFRTLHGSLPRPDLPPHTPAHARSFLRLAQQALATTALHHARAQEALLIHWAHQNNLLIQRDHLPAAFQPHDLMEDNQMEHHVWPDATGQRVLKLTHAGHFGLWPVADGHGWDMRTQAATPARYLSRLHAANTHLGDDWILHAIVTDPHHGHVQFLTSQPIYPGITPGDIIGDAPESQHPKLRRQQQPLITHALTRQGFHPTVHSPSTFYRPHDNLAMLDAHLHNLMWLPTPHRRTLMPFDVILLHPQGRLRQNITASLLTALKIPRVFRQDHNTTEYH